MITQTDRDCELRKLVKRRQQLRFRLQDHFSLPVSERNYHEFESVVDELEDVRKKIGLIKRK